MKNLLWRWNSSRYESFPLPTGNSIYISENYLPPLRTPVKNVLLLLENFMKIFQKKNSYGSIPGHIKYTTKIFSNFWLHSLHFNHLKNFNQKLTATFFLNNSASLSVVYIPSFKIIFVSHFLLSCIPSWSARGFTEKSFSGKWKIECRRLRGYEFGTKKKALLYYPEGLA